MVSKKLLWKPLKAVDSIAGALLGLSKALVLIWIIGELAMIFPQEKFHGGQIKALSLPKLKIMGQKLLQKLLQQAKIN